MTVFLHIILLLSSLYIPCECQQPRFSCMGDKPFKNKDLTCADFSEVCVKKDDPDCESFQKTCLQCPPSNTTVKALLNHLTLSKDVLEKKMEALDKKIDVSAIQQQKRLEKKLNDTTSGFLCSDILILMLLTVIILILIFEIRFKLFTKAMEKCTNKGRKRLFQTQENILNRNKDDSRILPNEYDNLVTNPNNTSGWKQNNDELLAKINEILDFKQTFDELRSKINEILEIRLAKNHGDVDQINKDHSGSVIKFQINNKKTPIELYVTSDDNVVQIKRQICTKCIDAKLNYKKMQLKYKETTLDDNQYLLSNFQSMDDIVYCEINDAINPSDIVVLNVHGNIRIPRLIQVKKNQTISDLKNIIPIFNNSKNIKIFKDRIELNDEQTFEYCDLVDDDSIQVVEIENGRLIMNSIVGDADPILIEYSNVDLVSSVKNKLKDKLTSLCDEIILYYDDKYLDEDKFIFEFKISKGSDIDYWRLLKLDRLIISSECLVAGNSSKIFKATINSSKKDIFIKMHQFESMSNWKANKDILNELRKCKLTKSHPRFVQLDEFYFDKEKFGVAMQYLGQSMKEYVTKTTSPFTENQIAKWSKQILEGLQVLHKQKVVYRNLILSDIFLDSDKNIKMSVFGLSKYVDFDDGGRVEGLVKRPTSKTQYPAPEMINKKPFSLSIDVWSFGSILLKIVTGNDPYQGIQIKDLMSHIDNNQEFKYTFNVNVSTELQSVIRSCLKINPIDRPTVDGLLRDEFIKKHEQ